MMETMLQHPLHDSLRDIPVKQKEKVQKLNETAVPTTRDESWKYTRVTRLLQHKWKHIPPCSGEIPQENIPSDWNVHVIDFIHGVCQMPDAELEAGVFLRHQHTALETAPHQYFEAVAEAACTSSVFIEIAANVHVTKPILIRHWIDHQGNFALPRVKLHVKNAAQVQVVEQFMGANAAPAFTIRTLFISVEDRARATWMKFQDDGEQSFLMNHEYVDMKRDAHFEMHTMTWRSGWVRNQLHIKLHEAGSFAKLNGVFLPRNQQFIDNHTRVDHIAPHCESSELYKGILMDRGTGVFNGKVHVYPHAQKTNAFQKNANILMDPEAQMNTKPELEIYADDVKCSHGSTTGRMDSEALFYLKSRGIGEGQAQKLLSRAFIGEVIDQLPNQQIRDWAYETMVRQELIFE